MVFKAMGQTMFGATDISLVRYQSRSKACEILYPRKSGLLESGYEQIEVLSDNKLTIFNTRVPAINWWRS